MEIGVSFEHVLKGVSVVRSFIRHPSKMPIEIRPDHSQQGAAESLTNISFGGVCFSSQAPSLPGTMVTLALPVSIGTTQVRGRVSWCRERTTDYEIGVEFLDASDFYTVRMVEQVCHIEQYRQQMREEQGRDLSTADAALEWIDRYAADFTNLAEEPRNAT